MSALPCLDRYLPRFQGENGLLLCRITVVSRILSLMSRRVVAAYPSPGRKMGQGKEPSSQPPPLFGSPRTACPVTPEY